jgi:hypothetical protein
VLDFMITVGFPWHLTKTHRDHEVRLPKADVLHDDCHVRRRIGRVRVGSAAARLALGLAIALGAVAAAGCAASPPGAAGAAALAAQGQTGAGVTGEYLPATMAQIADGTNFQQTITTLEKELFEDCIRNLGFGPKAQAYAFANLNLLPFQALSGYTQNQEASVGLVSLQSVSLTGMLAPVYIIGLRPNRSGIPPAEQRAVQDDQWRCWSKALQPTRQLDEEGQALWRQWYAAEIRLMTTAQVRSATKVFGSCVSHRGAPRTASESLGQFLDWLRQIVNRGVFGQPVSAVRASTQPRAELDAHWSRVFTTCGGPLVMLMQRLLPAAQQTFMQAHFGQVAALEKLAVKTVGTLEKLTETEF